MIYESEYRRKKIQDFFKNYFKTSLFLLTQTALTHTSEEKNMSGAGPML